MPKKKTHRSCSDRNHTNKLYRGEENKTQAMGSWEAVIKGRDFAYLIFQGPSHRDLDKPTVPFFGSLEPLGIEPAAPPLLLDRILN